MCVRCGITVGRWGPYDHASVLRQPVAAPGIGTRYIPASDFDDNTDRDPRGDGPEASDDPDPGGPDAGDRRGCFYDHPGLRPALRERGRAGVDLRGRLDDPLLADLVHL